MNNGLSIYDIDQQIADCIDAETGEVIDIDALQALTIARETKLENISCWIVNLSAESKAIKEQERILKERREQCERKAEQLTQFLASVLGGEKFKTAKVSVSYRKSEAVEIDSEAEIPDSYMNVIVERKPDKVAIKAAIKAGSEVPGAHLETRSNLTIK